MVVFERLYGFLLYNNFLILFLSSRSTPLPLTPTDPPCHALQPASRTD